jgi:Bacterial PH domain
MGIFTGNAGRKDAAAIQAEYARIFAQDEQVHAAYGVARDVFIFTNMRLVLVDKQGMTGKKISYESIPYKSVERFSVETAGSFDLDAELKIWVRGRHEHIAKQFDKSANIYEVQAILASFAIR